MRNARLRFPRFFLLPFFLFIVAFPNLAAAANNDGRDVRLGIVEGDVRLSRGIHDRPDLNQPWEQAIPGEPLSQGFALATGVGRDTIDFEDGSTVYLAENSVLVFSEISATEVQTHSSLVLITGSASFSFKPPIGGNYVIITPLDRIFISSPQSFYARIDAYLDATAITPLARSGDVMERAGAPDLRIAKDETIFMAHGEILSMPGEVVGDRPQDTWAAVAKCAQSLAINASLNVLDGTFLRSLCSPYNSAPADNSVLSAEDYTIPAASHPSDVHRNSQAVGGEWDSWVDARQNQKKSLLAAAMNASGLVVPIPGLAELFQHGAFFQCAPYGTCWEPTETPLSQSPTDPQVRSQNPPRPTSSSQNSTFQPQTVQIPLFRQALCGLDSWTTIARVAHSQAELEELRRLKEFAERDRTVRSLHFPESCFQHTYIPHNGHYARVLTPNRPPVCHEKKCKHPPFPHGTVVRIGGRIGVVPRHPADVKGKPPINLKNGILLPPTRPGEPFERVALDPSVKIKVLDRLPSSFLRESGAHAPAVAAPEIRAHLVSKDLSGDSAPDRSASSSKTEIVYDYRSQRFLLPGNSVHGQSFHSSGAAEIAGSKISGLMNGHSDHSASSFARSNTSSGSGGASSRGESGGSRSYSGSNSGGSHSSSSGPSGSSSASNSGASHSSGGGSSSSSSGGSSSSSGANSGGSGSRPH
jgi:hypothetical protein